ncbi:hypothetical protein M951_chr1174 (nucleomorph) [Lotharella oceanica]|uniref:Uncharacterized protein n=1 Tax=Lotharella oceanica TaxID=641309 RepID=A0A060DFQ5_9EUKA|nr:hypothetical protein M951_chr1174 [Lotharella oceanica]|mmetsp:Transcript_4461/g.8943  ORF Transcript_4461/g.8943 Transcript_4461/m.8943 type:complete len:144 (+) Transcript_4461:3265-3696(+)
MIITLLIYFYLFVINKKKQNIAMAYFIKLYFLEKNNIINLKIVFRKFNINSYYFNTLLKHRQSHILCIIKKKKSKNIFKNIIFRFDFLNVSYSILYLLFVFLKSKKKKIFNNFIFLYYRLFIIKLKIKNLSVLNHFSLIKLKI